MQHLDGAVFNAILAKAAAMRYQAFSASSAAASFLRMSSILVFMMSKATLLRPLLMTMSATFLVGST